MKSDFFIPRLVSLFKKNRLVQSISVSCESAAQREAMALKLSQDMFCSNENELAANSECECCQKIEAGNHPDVYFYKPEKNEIPLEDVKTMLRWLNISPHEKKHKILHIHDAHKLNASSSNALLKSMEEPPSFAHIVLWSENQNRLLRTILSRSLKCNIQSDVQNNTETQEPPTWITELNSLLEHKNHTGLDSIFNFSKSIAKDKEEHHFFFKQLYETFLKHYTKDIEKNQSLHLNRMEAFHALLNQGQSQVLNRYGNAQLWIERLLIDWKRLWNLAQ